MEKILVNSSQFVFQNLVQVPDYCFISFHFRFLCGGATENQLLTPSLSECSARITGSKIIIKCLIYKDNNNDSDSRSIKSDALKIRLPSCSRQGRSSNSNFACGTILIYTSIRIYQTSENMYVCICNSISHREIEDAVKRGDVSSPACPAQAPGSRYRMRTLPGICKRISLRCAGAEFALWMQWHSSMNPRQKSVSLQPCQTGNFRRQADTLKIT